MGTFLACVQLHLDDQRRAKMREAVVEALRERVLHGPFVETTDEADADRTVYIGPLGEKPWLTVFDSQGDLRKLAQELSAKTRGTAVFINLIDSDVVHLRRYTMGEIVDDYCNAPDQCSGYIDDPDWVSDWGDRSQEELVALTRGEAAKWLDLLAGSADPAKVQEVWQSKPVFADDILWAMVDALAMNEEEIWTASEGTGFERLMFRLTEPRRYEIKAEGPPILQLTGHGGLHHVCVGDPLEMFAGVQNNGGPATGLDVITWGSALDRGIAAVQKASIESATNPAEAQEAAFVRKQRRLAEKEIALFVASFPDLELPQGIAGGLETTSQSGVDWNKAYEALRATQIYVRVAGTVQRTGSGELCLAFSPHANRKRGQAVYPARLEAHPAPRRPLRSRQAPHPVSSDLLRKLEKPDQLFAMVVLGASREQSAEVVADALETWASYAVGKPSERLTAGLRSDIRLLPTRQKLMVAEIVQGKRRSTMREALVSCVSFELKSRSSRALFDASPLSFQHSNELPVPHLGFWFPCSVFDETRLAEIEKWLTGLVDSLMQWGDGLQAVMGKWDWWESTSLDLTPYEIACALGGQCTTGDFWCRRYLRGVTGRIWLGRDLLSHLGSLEPLEALAAITDLGGAIRLELGEQATMDEFERALAPLLPSGEDWRDGMGRIYPRK